MNFTLILHQSEWRTIFTIPRGTVLQKGRHGLYHEIIKAAQSVKDRFGCYSWGSESVIYYCGSFTDYARPEFKTNLQGRIHNYLQNHRLNERTGRKNTNLIVFESINKALRQSDIFLRLLTFESLEIDDAQINFDTFTKDPNLIHAVESLLICNYRRQRQCEWNRT